MIKVNIPARTVFVNGVFVPTSRKEFDVLALLIKRAGVAVRTEEIFKTVWKINPDQINGSKTLSMHMVTLRQKLGLSIREPIVTLRGVGFRLDLDDRFEIVR